MPQSPLTGQFKEKPTYRVWCLFMNGSHSESIPRNFFGAKFRCQPYKLRDTASEEQKNGCKLRVALWREPGDPDLDPRLGSTLATFLTKMYAKIFGNSCFKIFSLEKLY
jgi:hypothetical protein